ncbi:MAG: hypothetical protein M0030_13055 [Actinomycetota bacterium]|nr:hypothetical protein [Actinomycetota bacterium]
MEEHNHSGPPSDQAYSCLQCRAQECKDIHAKAQRDRRAAKKAGLWTDGRAGNGNAANFRHRIYKRIDFAIAESEKVAYNAGALRALLVLVREGEVTDRELAAATGSSRVLASVRLEELAEAGIAVQVGDDKFAMAVPR